MEDRFGIDSQKIVYHPEWQARWKKDPFSVPPLYLEISPVGHCNHRCTFCAPEMLGYVNRALPFEAVVSFVRELKDLRDADPDGLGVKGIMYAGEGEPTLHPKLSAICAATKEAGIEVALTTNATGLSAKTAEQLLPVATWIKASVNAGTPETYARIHRTRVEHWDLVWRNLEAAAELRGRHGFSVTLGAQMVLLVPSPPSEEAGPVNWDEAVAFARRAKEAGLDYAVVKPYSQHFFSEATKRRYGSMSYGLMDEVLARLARELRALDDERFHVVFRERAMQEYEVADRGYSVCQATPTAWAYVQSDGELISCSAYWTDPRFYLGNIIRAPFKDIWWGERRREHLAFVLGSLDISECRKNCRMHQVNQQLWALKHPPAHANFI